MWIKFEIINDYCLAPFLFISVKNMSFRVRGFVDTDVEFALCIFFGKNSDVDFFVH